MLLRQRPLPAARILLRDGRKHASPNAGLAEAAVAGALGVQLGGRNFYGGQPVDQPAVGDPLWPLTPAAHPRGQRPDVDRHGAVPGRRTGAAAGCGASLATLGDCRMKPQQPFPCPRLVIAGTGSGVGKTSLALGVVRALRRQGLRVQTFKAGPDFLDPTYLARASGRTCYNLDAWMTSAGYVRQLFAQATAEADLAVIEGVMGLFDGASPASLEGSTAEIALLLAAPVVLAVNAHGAARSLAATVKGFAQFEPAVRIAGVIANHAGTPRHGAWLAEALAGAKLPPLLGAVPRGALPTLASRHLGLVTADQSGLDDQTLDLLADGCSQYIDMKSLLDLASVAEDPREQRGPAGTAARHHARVVPARRVRLGIARDEAFHFYYPDNLESLCRGGGSWPPSRR